jgi:hypothetical protein
MAETVVAPIGFVSGKVTVSEPPGKIEVQVRMRANDATGGSVEQFVPVNSSYVLCVAPGSCNVFATLGAVTAGPKLVRVEVGKSSELNFHFGKNES